MIEKSKGYIRQYLSYIKISHMDETQRKSDRKSAKKIIKLAKEHKGWYTKEDVKYAKLIKKRTKKPKQTDNEHT